MNKFCVYKGKAGYDFRTLADTEAMAKDIAWQQHLEKKRDDLENLIYPDDPFSWWEILNKQWGHDKWYVDELYITKIAHEKPKAANKVDE